MHGYFGQIFSIVLTAVIAAAPGFCPCVNGTRCDHQASEPKAAAGSGYQSHGCCGRKSSESVNDQSPASPAPDSPDKQPCKSCKMTAKAERSTGKPSQLLDGLQLALAPLLVILPEPAPPMSRPVIHLPAADIPPPLLDLFHSSCLLLI